MSEHTNCTVCGHTIHSGMCAYCDCGRVPYAPPTPSKGALVTLAETPYKLAKLVVATMRGEELP